MLVRKRAKLVYEVTEDLKTQLTQRMDERLKKTEAALGAVQSALREFGESAGGNQLSRLKAQGEKLQRTRDEAVMRLAQIKGLALGSEIAEGAVEIASTIEIGDPEERLQDAEIVISGGRIKEIRNQ